MNESGPNMLGLVELADADELADRHGKLGLRDMQAVFLQRLQDWLRPRDEWQQVDDTRALVVLRGVGSRGELALAAAKLERLFEEPHFQFGRPVRLGFRAGFTEAENPDAERETALRQAGIALREAQVSRQPYQLYVPAREASAQEERRMLEALAAAVDRGELQLFFQPKVNAVYRSIVGAEALLRWKTRDGNFIPPDQFIPLAESHEVIRPLTWWAIKSSVARLSRWPTDLSIAVNIAPQLLLNDQIQSVVSDALEIHGVAANRLVLEVTERIMVENQQTMMAQLAQLRMLGVRVSLDDFGTGFSSLSYFRDLPVDEIKIDMTFVRNMLGCGKDHAIVKAVIDLAHNFSMKVVAEGVESNDIAERLKELGCDILQGYAFDRPLPVEVFEASYGIRHPSLRDAESVRDHPLM